MEEDDEMDDSETDESEAVDDGDWDVDYDEYVDNWDTDQYEYEEDEEVRTFSVEQVVDEGWTRIESSGLAGCSLVQAVIAYQYMVELVAMQKVVPEALLMQRKP